AGAMSSASPSITTCSPTRHTVLTNMRAGARVDLATGDRRTGRQTVLHRDPESAACCGYIRGEAPGVDPSLRADMEVVELRVRRRVVGDAIRLNRDRR